MSGTVTGYGIIIDGKPTGIWPTSLSHCRARAKDLKNLAVNYDKAVEIVPVYAGMPVPLEDPPPLFPPPPALELA